MSDIDRPELQEVIDDAVRAAVEAWQEAYAADVHDAIALWQKAHSVGFSNPSGYEAYEASPAWGVIAGALSELFEKQDLIEHPGTARYYPIGYLVKKLTEAGLLT